MEEYMFTIYPANLSKQNELIIQVLRSHTRWLL